MKPVECLALVYENGEVYIDSTIKDAQTYVSAIPAGQKATVKRVKVQENKKRSLPANALMHKWFDIVSKHTGENEIAVKCRFKRDFAWPVVQINQPEWAERISFVLKRIGYDTYSDSQQLKVWEMLELTSQMNTPDLRSAMEKYKLWALDTLVITLDNGKA